MIPLLSLIPFKAWLYLGAAIALAGSVYVGIHKWNAHEQAIGAAPYIAENIRRAAQAQEAIAANQIESARRVSAQAEVSHEADRFNAVAAAAAHDAAAADVRLRDRLAAAGRRAAAPDPAAAAPGASTDPPASVPYGVFTRVDDAAGQLATYSDQLRIALGACINSYAALTP